eukprot:m.133672 g.133672  ORF g.133672 m.133672 type:complete len:87 (-) comp13946_c1_seq1:3382-3642(-)
MNFYNQVLDDRVMRMGERAPHTNIKSFNQSTSNCVQHSATLSQMLLFILLCFVAFFLAERTVRFSFAFFMCQTVCQTGHSFANPSS